MSRAFYEPLAAILRRALQAFRREPRALGTPVGEETCWKVDHRPDTDGVSLIAYEDVSRRLR